MGKDILVTGGAGYIGSHAVISLLEKGFNPIIIDNFSRSSKKLFNYLFPSITYYEGNVDDECLLSTIFFNHKIKAVLHFAAYAYVGESNSKPLIYYTNNSRSTLNLLNFIIQNCSATDIPHFVFSSTCSVYGNTSHNSISELTTLDPINPYAKSKYFIESMLYDFHNSYGINYTIFRYFNAAGAHFECRAGEFHEPEPHLIPNIIKSALNNQIVLINGIDYATKDGTCIRDYTHVSDIAEAHTLILDKVLCDNLILKSNIFNLGTGTGHSIFDIIKTIERVTDKKIRYRVCPRRPGDPTSLIADSQKITKVIGWKPIIPEIDKIVLDAYNWELKLQKLKVNLNL